MCAVIQSLRCGFLQIYGIQFKSIAYNGETETPRETEHDWSGQYKVLLSRDITKYYRRYTQI